MSFELLDIQKVSLFVITKSGEIIFVNKQAKKFLDIQKEYLPDDFLEDGFNYFAFHHHKVIDDFPAKEGITLGNEIIEVYFDLYPEQEDKIVVSWVPITKERTQVIWNTITEDQINYLSNELLLSSNELKEISLQINKVAKDTSTQTEEMSTFFKWLNEYSKEMTEVGIKTAEVMTQITDESTTSFNMSDNALDKIEHSVLIISQLNKIVSEIGNKANLIEHTMEKSKVLSVNARIESARAGKYGLGFAVIASNMKDFSQSAIKLSMEIKKIISEILQLTTFTVRDINQIKDIIGQLKDFTFNTKTSISEQTTIMVDKYDEIEGKSKLAQKDSSEMGDQIDFLTTQSNEVVHQSNNGIKIASQFEDTNDTLKIISDRLKDEMIIMPSDVYRLMIIISNMTDALLEKKLRQNEYEELRGFIAQVYTDKKPKDVIGLSAKTSKLFLDIFKIEEGKLKLSEQKITPTQVYAFVQTFAEVIGKQLINNGVHDIEHFKRVPPFKNKKPGDVYGVIEMINKKLTYFQKRT